MLGCLLPSLQPKLPRGWRKARLAFLEPLERRDMLSFTMVSVDRHFSPGSEPGGDASFVFRAMPAAPPSGLTINFSVGGTASAGNDYVSIGTSVTIPANQMQTIVTVDVIDDTFWEGAAGETVEVTIQPSPDYFIDGTGFALVVIQDDDIPSPALEAASNDTISCDCPCTCGETNSSAQQPADGNNANQNQQAGVKNNSTGASGQTVIATNASFAASGPDATAVKAESTFNGSAGPTAHYEPSSINPGDKYRIALPVDTSAMEPGYYPWEIEVTETYPHSPDVVRTIEGASKVKNTTDSEFGPGWLHPGIDKLKIQPTGTTTKGVLWLKGDGNAFWFAENSPGVFTRQAGEPDFSTLVKETNGTYTLRKKNGETLSFSPQGTNWAVLSSRTDRVGNVTSYAYVNADGDARTDEISTITYPGGLVETFNYTGALVTAIVDSYGRTTSLGYTGGKLTTITEPDPDDAGPLTAPVTTIGYTGNLVGSITDPRNETISFAYVNKMIRTVTHPGGGVETIHAQLGRALEDGLGSAGTPRTLYAAADVKATYKNEVNNTWTITFNKFGNALSVVDPLGKVTDYEINSENLVTKRTDPDPDDGGAQVRPVTNFGHDSKGNVTSITYPDTSSETWVFESTFSQPTSYTNRRGKQTTFVVNATNGNITEVRQVNGGGSNDSVTTIGYTTTNVKGLPSSVTDPRGFVTNYVHNTHGLVTSVTSAAGTADETTLEFSYDTFDNLQWSEDGLNRRTDYTWDKLDRLLTITLPDPDAGGPLVRPVTTHEYNKNNYLTKVTDPLGHFTEYVYNGRNDVVEIKQPDPDGGGPLGIPTTIIGYDLHRRQTSVTDPLSRVTSFGYDALDRNTSVTLPDPDGAGGPLTSPVYAYDYDNIGRVIEITDPLNNVTLLDHATWNRIAATLPDPDAGGPLGSSTTVTLFDAEGNLTSYSDELSRTTAWRYDNLGRLDQVTYADPDGGGPLTSPIVGIGYDKSSNQTSVTDARGFSTAYAYDGLNRLTSLTEADPDGGGPLTSPVTAYAYNDAHELVTVTDALSHVTTNAYDGIGRLKTVTLPDPDSGGPLAAPVLQYAYDAASRLTSETDALSNVTTRAYDNLDRVTSITEPDPDAGGPLTSPVTAFTYDAVGNTLTLTDPVSNDTTWVYDNLDRVITETNELSDARSFEYDAVGNLKKKTDRNGRVTEYAYDNRYRNTHEIWKSGGATVRTIEFTHDAAGQMTGATDASGTLAYVYDTLGRITSETQTIAGLTPTLAFAHTYDANSNRLTLSSTIGGTADFKNTYTFDNLDRMTRVVQEDVVGGNVVADKRVDFAYNALGQFTQIDRYQSTGTSNAVAQTVFSYDALNRLTAMDHKQGSTVLAGYDYTYDVGSRITSIDSFLDGLATYTYDNTDQLTAADHTGQADESYSYDTNGNRTMTGYVVQANNRTTSDGTYNYEYDDEGNRTKRTKISDGSYEEYAWDHRNRLTGVTFKTSAGVVTKTVAHTYDLLDRWTRRTVDPDGPGAQSAVDTFFAYEGGSIDPVLQFNGTAASNLNHRYLWGPNVDQILADEDVDSLSSAGNVIWPFTDHLGTASDLGDYNESTGVTTVANHREFNSFGAQTAETNSAVDLLFGFTGKPLDDSTNLQNNWRRWYDAAIGQWVSEDPIGFTSFDTNLARYVHNNPIGAIDFTGLAELVVTPVKPDSMPWKATKLDGKRIAQTRFPVKDITGTIQACEEGEWKVVVVLTFTLEIHIDLAKIRRPTLVEPISPLAGAYAHEQLHVRNYLQYLKKLQSELSEMERKIGCVSKAEAERKAKELEAYALKQISAFSKLEQAHKANPHPKAGDDTYEPIGKMPKRSNPAIPKRK